jgi:hypothetical protein
LHVFFVRPDHGLEPSPAPRPSAAAASRAIAQAQPDVHVGSSLDALETRLEIVYSIAVLVETGPVPGLGLASKALRRTAAPR